MRRVLSIGLMFVLTGFAVLAADSPTRRSFMVRLFGYPEVRGAVDDLRAAGFRVDVLHQKDMPASFAECTVIAVGSDVPAVDAAEAIRIAHKALPSLKYVFIREDPELAEILFVGTYGEWVESKQLKPLAAKDFDALGEGEMTQAAFHARVRRFGL